MNITKVLRCFLFSVIYTLYIYIPHYTVSRFIWYRSVGDDNHYPHAASAQHHCSINMQCNKDVTIVL